MLPVGITTSVDGSVATNAKFPSDEIAIPVGLSNLKAALPAGRADGDVEGEGQGVEEGHGAVCGQLPAIVETIPLLITIFLMRRLPLSATSAY